MSRSQAGEEATSRVAWLGFGAAATMGIGTIVPSTVGVSAPWLIEEIPNGAFVVGAANSVTYGVGAAAALGLSGLVGRHRSFVGVRFVLAVASVSLLAIGLGSAAWHIVVAAALGGISGGLSNTSTNLVLSRGAAPRQVPMLAGIKQAGAKLGGLLAGTVVPVAGMLFDWRVGLFLMAGMSLVLAAVWRPAELSTADGVSASRRTRSGPMTPAWRPLAAYSLLLGVPSGSVITFLPLFGHQGLGLSASRAGVLTGLAAVGALAARLVYGWLMVRQVGPPTMLVGLALASAGALLLASLSGILSAPWLLIVASVLLGATVGAWTTPVHAAVLAFPAGSDVASVSGRIQAAFSLGLLTGPSLLGGLVIPRLGLTWIWSVCALFALSGFVIALTSRRHLVRRSDVRDGSDE